MLSRPGPCASEPRLHCPLTTHMLCKLARLCTPHYCSTDPSLSAVTFTAELALLAAPTQLPNSLEALFRRGADFESGCELIALLQLRVSAPSVNFPASISSLPSLLPLLQGGRERLLRGVW